tara:strand:- start:1629 stop:2063 length:435 start_codon:yes stop_codon:yes gene_type:complete
MAKISYSWSKVKKGDIISFRYPTKEGRIFRRTILVLEPKLRNKAKNPNSDFLLHGIQLEVSNRPITNQIKEILQKAGKVEIVDEEANVYRVVITDKTQQTYNKLKTFIKKIGNFRTYNYQKVTRSQVFLEDLRLPNDFVEELLK